MPLIVCWSFVALFLTYVNMFVSITRFKLSFEWIAWHGAATSLSATSVIQQPQIINLPSRDWSLSGLSLPEEHLPISLEGVWTGASYLHPCCWWNHMFHFLPLLAFFFSHTLKHTPQLLTASISDSRCRFSLLQGCLWKLSSLSQFITAVTRFLVSISACVKVHKLQYIEMK